MVKRKKVNKTKVPRIVRSLIVSRVSALGPPGANLQFHSYMQLCIDGAMKHETCMFKTNVPVSRDSEKILNKNRAFSL